MDRDTERKAQQIKSAVHQRGVASTARQLSNISFLPFITTSSPRPQHLPPIQPLDIGLVVQQVPVSPTTGTQSRPRPRRQRRRSLIPVDQIRHRLPCVHRRWGRHAAPWQRVRFIAVPLRRGERASRIRFRKQRGFLARNRGWSGFAQDLRRGLAVHGDRGGGGQVAVWQDGEGAGGGVGSVAAEVADGVARAVEVGDLVWIFGVVLWCYHLPRHWVG